MIQRIVFTAIADKLAAMASDPTLLDDLFGYTWGLSATEVAGIKSYFASHPIRVQHGYAVTEVNPPLVAITLQAESQSDFFEGDAAGFSTTPPPGWAGFVAQPSGAYGAQIEGSVWEYSYRVLCISENIDVTSYMYEMVKSALLGSKEYFISQGIMLPSYTGMDLAPDPRYTPEHLFTRVLGMRCKRVFSVVDRSSALGRAHMVSGVAIPAASPHDNGGVPTGVDVESLTTSQDDGDRT